MRLLLILIALVFAGCGDSKDSKTDRIADGMDDVARAVGEGAALSRAF